MTEGTGALLEIAGGTDSVAMFKIKAAGSTLTAWEANGSDPFQLFLFGGTGLGVKASMSGTGGTDVFTGDPAGVALMATGLTAGGDYFLAIVANFWEPRDAAGNMIFDSFGDPNPDADALHDWFFGTVLDPPFSISLLNVNPSTEPQTQVPEPATLLLIGAGLVGLGIAARRRRRA